jgi:hypothetical protein
MSDAARAPGGAALHFAILSAIVERGYAPDVEELAERLQCDVAATGSALLALAEDHGVLLHPGSTRVWVAHPFSTAPTGFTVQKGASRWWGNCVWCSLGIAGLLGGDVTITTTLGGEDRQVVIHVTDDGVAEKDLVVHFPVPMTQVWDNVVYSCSTMLAFEDEAAVEEWCRRHGIAKGDVRSIKTVWRFAVDWYGRHLDPDWRKWTVDEARDIITRHGLDGPIWELPAAAGRF